MLIKGSRSDSVATMILPCINIFESGGLHTFHRCRNATLDDVKASSDPTDIFKPIGIDPVVIKDGLVFLIDFSDFILLYSFL